MGPQYTEVIGKKLSDFLHRQRETQAEFGKRIGLEAPVINRAANAKLKNPQYETIEALAVGMGVEVWELLRPSEALTKVRNDQRALDNDRAEKPARSETADPKKGFGGIVGRQARGVGTTDNHEPQKRGIQDEGFHPPLSEGGASDLNRSSLLGKIIIELAKLHESELRDILDTVKLAASVHSHDLKEQSGQ